MVIAAVGWFEANMDGGRNTSGLELFQAIGEMEDFGVGVDFSHDEFH